MPKDESEIGEKLPELFDIHVMFFADTSNQAITALQRAFSLERSVAEKLIADAPVMLKRAVSPEVADSLLDVLNSLGAQVVLLPSTAGASAVPDDAAGNLLSGGGQDEPARFTPDAAASPLELDLDEIAEPLAAGRGPSGRDADLGLGSVPPLPSASAARPAIPRVPPARPVAAPAPPAPLAKAAPNDESAVLPDLQLAVPDSGDAFWAAKRKPADRGQGGGDATASQTRSQPPRSSTPAEAPRSRTFALSALLGGVLLFAVSGYFDQSIFSGSASPLWVVVQGFGFLGVGTGCARIRR